MKIVTVAEHGPRAGCVFWIKEGDPRHRVAGLDDNCKSRVFTKPRLRPDPVRQSICIRELRNNSFGGKLRALHER